MQLIASLISYLLHPLLMPSYCLLIIFYYDNLLPVKIPEITKQMVLGLVVLNTFVMPALAAALLKKFGYINSLKMERREERVLPFFIAVVFYVGCYYSLREVNLPQNVLNLLLGAAIAVGVAAVVSLFWKVSIHLVGMGGFTAMMFLYFNPKLMEYNLHLMIVFILSGMAGTARLIKESHSESQVYGGYILGFIAMMFPFVVL